MGEDFYEHVQIKNGLAKFLIKSYFTKLEEILKKINFSNFLDVGAGNGYVTDYVKKLTNSEAFAIDNNENKIKSIQNKYPFIKSIFANAENIPYPESYFDLTICTQTLEHIPTKNLNRIIDEISRVSKDSCLFTVPREPQWRLKNLARGKYLQSLGNPPEHIQHWNKKSFNKLLLNHFDKVEVDSNYVWLMALCKK